MTIDINCDVGEGLDNEAVLLPYISTCNIACGAHAGDEETMRKVLRLAKKHNVKAGAHPSYPDRENFGRTVMNMEMDALSDTVYKQILKILAIAGEEGISLYHTKPHGALYNEAARNENVAKAVIDAIKRLDIKIKLMAPFDSVIARLAEENGIEMVYEAFADRNYNEDLSLVSRKQPNALLHQPEQILEHVLRMVRDGEVKTITGEKIKIKADSFCIHGDNENAIAILKFLIDKLPGHSIEVLK
ncbi:5-oxoprolinase subunit PxpA [Leptobacterium flavescens]|uniref:5-oxoprolinase subunit PxpA n=1 Tax=Leptobacterium flavescens TaxID=472055 RepID=A0A6P0UKX0_9FLAO|nr:5-oxoprolinase subunit PxpA [Leptobacterium flavescens]NER13925.1 5-oxoprolinase subunit PxpA [Leptobacterium flavescens]